ncbi:peptidase M48 Ste24p [Thalassoporum mexicanum PCC 7367]|uniref:M48 family metallopeptidase n=1 Tax=Thalassoporum mexicanum TaxID=3457544 RepID=UPI00029F8187|nr:M48 family metallopeptidase [Pseudanabaena sp. PCC 7367]AFY71738.1 peptidase M48 Ste24p [Pseudanabaena sp. PCC 7367]
MPTYTGISSEAFRHPLDLQAEQSLRSVPGFDLLARKFIEFLAERPGIIYNSGSFIQAGPRQYATIYRIFRECAHDLDVYPEPTLFVAQNPIVNSYALGKDKPYIMLYTGVLELLNEDEIRAVLAHELGHIKCGHSVLIQMAIWVMNIAHTISEFTFGLGDLATLGLLVAFFEWRRKAELSCDRAALLVTDDLELVMTSLMKLSGGSKAFGHELSLPEFKHQSDEFQDLDKETLNQIYKFLIYNGVGNTSTFLSHPLPVERIRYVGQWADSFEYAEIKAGNYKREGATGSVEVEIEQPDAQTSSKASEAGELRRQIEDLQNEIDRLRRERGEDS